MTTETKRRLTQKQETFCLKYFELGNASKAARLAKYSPKTAGVIGRENLLKPQIKARLTELREATESETIATVAERKQKLADIIRHQIEKPITAGHQIAAIREQNLMERIYEESGVKVDNKVLVVNVISENARKLTEEIVSGKRTEASEQIALKGDEEGNGI